MFNFSDTLNPLKPLILIILGAFWVYQGRLDMPRTIVSSSYFGKRPTAREMITSVFHVDAQHVNSYWWNFANSAVWPSPGMIFGLLLLPWAWEIELGVYQLWRISFLWICWFSIIYMWGMHNTSPDLPNLPATRVKHNYSFYDRRYDTPHPQYQNINNRKPTNSQKVHPPELVYPYFDFSCTWQ